MALPEGLSTLFHFYNDDRNLFRTVTMYSGQERDRVLDQIVSNRAWYWGRFAKSERVLYMLQRETVEKLMRAEFERKFWKLPFASPVYFYIYPHLDLQRLLDELDHRARFDEQKTKILTFQLNELLNTKSVSFTLEDSFQSYKLVLRSQGIPVRTGRPELKCAECQGRIFYIEQLQAVYAKHHGDQGVYFEVQVWDGETLEPAKERLSTRT
jgi:hypothetical protein